MADALFIAVEGVDRAGKTTLVAALADTFRSRGLAVATRAEPSHGPVGVLFRKLAADPAMSATTAALLSAADRHHQQPSLSIDLAGHDLLLADRYYLSGLAYHHTEGVDPGFYRTLNTGIRRPHLYLYLTIALPVATRRGPPPHGRWEHTDLTARLPAAYTTGIRLITDREQARVVPLDATPPPAQVLAAAITAIDAARPDLAGPERTPR